MRVSRGLTSDDQRAPRTIPVRPIDHRTAPSGSSAATSRWRVTATNAAFGDQEPSHQAPSRRLEPSNRTSQGPFLELTRSGPGAGSDVRAGLVVTFSSVTASAPSRRAPGPGRDHGY